MPDLARGRHRDTVLDVDEYREKLPESDESVTRPPLCWFLRGAFRPFLPILVCGDPCSTAPISG